MVTREEIAFAAKQRGLAIDTTTVGPFFKITARRLPTRAAAFDGADVGVAADVDDADIIGEHDGFIAPPPFGILHMDSMRIYNSRVRGDDERAAMRSLFGISILLGSTSALMAHEAGCTKMELLAIDDGNEYAAKLVKYYGRLGFETVRKVGDNGGARITGEDGLEDSRAKCNLYRNTRRTPLVFCVFVPSNGAAFWQKT